MTISLKGRNEQNMNQRHDEPYIRSVTELGDTRNVVTSQAIYAGNNIKLVEKGVRVDSSLYERLVRHKLVPQIDECLMAEDGVDQQTLLDYAKKLFDERLDFPLLDSRPDYRERMLQAIAGIPLPPPLAFKLTVAQCQRPEIFDHSIRIALISLYLAIRSQQHSDQELVWLAAAAVLHDIGMLHIPRDLLQSGYRMEQGERRHLYAHPITGFLILSKHPQCHPHISRPVFEHHERLDGSGYPRGLIEADICAAAQVLMLADVAAVAFERRPQPRSLARLSVLLRLNQRKFNRELGNLLISLISALQEGMQPEACAEPLPAVAEKSEKIASVFREWNAIGAECRSECGRHPAGDYVESRMSDLLITLLDAGFDIDKPAAMLEILSGDEIAMQELNLLMSETRWQLLDIFNEVRRRWQKADVAGISEPVVGWRESCENILLG